MSESRSAKKKNKNHDRLTVRDFLTLALMFILILVVFAVVGTPVAMSVVGYIFMFAVTALFWGTIFMLMYVRVNKKWMPLIIGVALGLLQIFNLWMLAVILVLGGVISEIIWQKFDRKSFKTMTACFTVQITSWYLGNFVPMIMITNLEDFLAVRYLELFIPIKEAVEGPLFFIGLAATILGCLIGAFIGKKLLKKHFERAGVI